MENKDSKIRSEETFSSNERGIHGDAYDFFSYEFTKEYNIYFNKYFRKNEIIPTTLFSFTDLALEVRNELTLLEDDKIINYLGYFNNIH